jgi:glucose/arabinose dehydrogenase
MRRLAITLAAVALGGCGAQHAPSAPRTAAANPHSRFAAVTVTIPAGNGGNGLPSSPQLRLPRGWRAEAWARVPDARLEAWTPQGDLLVSEPANGKIEELTPQRDPATPPSQSVLVSGLAQPQGMAFGRVARQELLFVAEESEVDRYQWLGDRVGARRVVVANLPHTAPAGSDDHTLKNVVVGSDGRIYVDIASASNATPPTHTRPPRASVVSYTANGAHMRVLATGVRNGDGLSFAPDGTLWTAVNERDDISYPFHRSYGSGGDAYGQVIQAYVNNHPPDELARLTPGRDLGWPYCDPDPDVHPGRLETSFKYGNLPFTADQQTNPGGNVLNCSRLARLNRGIPAHSAPLGFHFLEGSKLPRPWSAGAVVAVHGSWDRHPPRAPAVLWLPWNRAKRTLGQAITLIGGFQYPNGSRWGRAVDAVPGPDGALYVSDDQSETIYRIVP